MQTSALDPDFFEVCWLHVSRACAGTHAQAQPFVFLADSAGGEL